MSVSNEEDKTKIFKKVHGQTGVMVISGCYTVYNGQLSCMSHGSTEMSGSSSEQESRAQVRLMP